MAILASLESAGEATLGTLFGYVTRHGLGDMTKYLGAPHVAIEERQAARIQEVAAPVMRSRDPALLALVGVVFDALTTMFSHGGDRYYAAHLETEERSWSTATT